MATYYKSTTAGNWSSTNSWATNADGTTGVPSGPPTNADDVIFNSVGANCTIDTTTCVAKTVDFTGGGASDYTGTLTHTAAMKLTVSGSVTFNATMTYTLGNAATSAFTINETANLNLAGKTIGNFIYNKSGGTLTLTADATCSGSWTNTAGSLAGNYAVILTGTAVTITPTAAFSFYNLTRTGTAAKTDTLTLAGNITVTNNLTINGNSATNRLLVTSDTIGTARTITCGNTKTFSNCDFRDITWNSTNACTISSAASDGATGTRFLCAAAHGLIAGDTIVIAGTTNYNGAKTVLNVSDTTHFDIADAYVSSQAGTWTLDISAITGASGNCGGNTGFTFTTAVAQYWKHGGAGTLAWSTNQWVPSSESLGSETLTNTALTSGTSWARTNDCALTGDQARFIYSAGTSSYLAQTNANLATTPVASAIYKLTYTMSSVSGTPAPYIGNGLFAANNVNLTVGNGTYSVYFISSSSAASQDFRIYCTLTAGQAFYLDDISVKQVTAGRVPLPQDSAYFDQYSFPNASAVVSQDMPRIGSVDFTGALNTPTWTTSTAASCFGSITLISGMTLTASSQTYTFEGRGTTYYLTSAGKSWAKQFTIDCPTGTLSISDAFSSTAAIQVNSGSLTSSANVTISNFASSNSATRAITLGAVTWTITQSVTGTMWNLLTTTGLSFTSTGSTLKFNGAPTAAQTLNMGNLTYNNIWLAAGAGTGTFQITGGCTCADFKDDGTAAHSVKFTKSTTTTVTSWNVGTTSVRAGTTNVITLDTVDGAGTFTVNFANADTVTACDYLNIQRSVAGGTRALWWAGGHSTNNNGAGSGWLFNAPPYVLLEGVEDY